MDRCRIWCWLAVPVYLWRAWPSWWSTVDDAWISARYAGNLAAGNGLVYSVGEPPVEGFTNLLWTVWIALGIAIGADENAWMTVSGLVFGALSIGLVGEAVRALLPLDAPGRRWPAVMASWIMALDVHFAVSSTNGLETSMYVASLMAAILLVRRAPWWAGGGLAAIAAVRPEGLLAGPMLLLLADRKRWPVLFAGLLVGWCALEGWRVWTYGALLPNTFAAKAERGMFDNIERNITHLSHSWPWWISVGVGLIASPLAGRRLRQVVPVVIGLGSAAAALRVYMWMPGGRLLVPVAFLTVVALATSASRWGHALLCAWAAVALAIPWTATETHQRRYDEKHSVHMPNRVSLAARHVAENIPAGSWITTRDAGVLAYFMGPEMKVAETHHRALTQPHPDKKSLYKMEHAPLNPAMIVLTVADRKSKKIRYPNDGRILKRATSAYTYLGRIKQHRRRYYDLYVREDLEVPPLPKAWVTNRVGIPKH